MPLALAVAGANVHDMRLVEPTLRGFAVRRPRPKRGARKQHFCGDKGYDYADVRALLHRFGYTLHIKSRGEEVTCSRNLGPAIVRESPGSRRFDAQIQVQGRADHPDPAGG